MPDGELIASFAADPDPLLRPQTDAITALPGQLVAATVDNTQLVLLDATTGDRIRAIDTQVSLSSARALTSTADGSLVAVGGAAGIFLWSPTAQQLIARAFPAGVAETSGELAPLDENRLLDAFRPQDSPVIWDLRESEPEPISFAGPGYIFGDSYSDELLSLFFFPGDEAPRTELWDAQTLTKKVTAETSCPAVAAYPDNGWWVGSCASQSDAPDEWIVFDIDTGEILVRRPGFVSFVQPADFNADGTRLITLTPVGNAALWDTSTWDVLREVAASDGDAISSARFSPSGDLVTADPTGTIVVRDAETLEQIGAPMIGHRGTGPIGLGLHFSVDGTRLLSTGEEAILWDLETRARIGSSFPGGGARSAVRTDRHFSADGENILVWNLDVDQWYGIACRAAGRNMTRAEWAEFGPRDAEYQATCAQFPLEG